MPLPDIQVQGAGSTKTKDLQHVERDGLALSDQVCVSVKKPLALPPVASQAAACDLQLARIN